MRRWFVMMLMLLVPAVASAQHVGDKEVSGLVGWQWGGTQEYANYAGYPAGDFHANANLNYAGAFTVFVRDYYGVEFNYSFQSTDLLVRPNSLPEVTLGKMTTQYIHAYGVRTMPMKEKVDGFVLAGLGATSFSAEGFETHWLFSVGAGLGVKIHTSDKLAIRLQSRMLLPIQWGETGLYFGTGGAGVSVGGGSSLIQGDVSAGLTIKLGS